MLTLPLANGRPSLFTDTKAYIVLGEQIAEKIGFARAGQSAIDLAGGPDVRPRSEESLKERISLGLTVAAARSPFYSFYLFTLAHFGTFWLVAVAQACVAASLIFAFSYAALPFGAVKLYYANIAVLAFLSTLPIYVGFMMPDITAGLGVLAAATLMLFPERMSGVIKLALATLILFSVLSHKTHQFLIAAVAFAGFFGLRFSGIATKIAGGRAAVLIAMVIIGALGWAAYRASARLIYHDEVRSPPFLMARVLEDGPGRDYLQSACAADAKAFELCRFQASPLNDSQTFLWLKKPGAGVFGPADYATRVRLIDEQWRFVWGTLLFAPGAQIAASAGNFIHQLMRVRVDDATDASAVMSDLEFIALRRLSPGSEPCWNRPDRCHSVLPDELIGWTDGLAFLFSLALSFMVIARNFKRNETGARQAAVLLATMLLVLIVNAAVCGVISGPFPRYQTRITWLFPLSFITILTLCRHREPVSVAQNAVGALSLPAAQ